MYEKLIRLVVLIGLIFLSPIFLIISLLIYKQMGRPIFFKQERAGKNGLPFNILKFRTMTNAKDANGTLLPSYERVTHVGKILRKTSLDEIPQLFNVVKGELTLVGPRPLHVEYNKHYNNEQKKRLNVLPGITGLAQVNGRNNITWDEKFKWDVKYVKDKSLLLDLKILIKTIQKVFSKSDINPDNLKETPRFKGDSDVK